MSRVLIASNLGFYSHGVGFDTYLYDLLGSDGHEVALVLCDGEMDACQMSKFSRISAGDLEKFGQSEICATCITRGAGKFGDSRNYYRLSSYSLPEEKSRISREVGRLLAPEIKAYIYRGINVGDHAFASAVRYFASLKFLEEPEGLGVLRKYLMGAINVVNTYERLLEEHVPDLVICHHGIYSPQGIVVELAKKFNIDVLTWIKTYRKDTFLFSWGDSYHHEMQTDNQAYKEFQFSNIEIDEAAAYLDARRTGESDSIHFNKNPERIDKKVTKKNYDLLLTSVFWDAQVHYKSNLFEDQADWIIQTIKAYARTPQNGDLIIRVHPAEVTGFIKSRDTAGSRITGAFSELPENVTLVDSDSKVSTYDLIDNAKSVLVYNTKASIEAAALGRVVVVAGDAWVRNCDFVLAPKSESDYLSMIESREQHKYKFDVVDAKRYFYHFYFRRMLEFPCFRENKKEFMFDADLYSGPLGDIQRRAEIVLLSSIRTRKKVQISREFYIW